MSRRRRNPVPSLKSFGTIGLLIAGGYVFIEYIWPLLSGLGSAAGAAGAAVDSATTGIANAFVNATAGPAPQVQGTVQMPDGTSFPSANLTNMNFGFVNGVAQFTFNGAKYSLSPQVNGVYQASPL